MKRFFLLTLLCLLFTCGFSQVKIGDNTTLADPSAVLEVESTTQGFLPPRLTELQRDAIASPATGLIIYCTDCCFNGSELQIFDGTEWTNTIMETVCSSIPPPHITKKNTAIWYFGHKAGLDFNSGSPAAITNGQMHLREGGATIADDDGNLLFYTDGDTVWNKNHAVMETGLLGHFSSSQSGIIVRKPESTKDFYIFTLDAVENNLADGLRYSEVDMTLNGGLGAVTTKNTLLYTPTCENITAVSHATENAIWLITHKFPGTEYVTYKITTSGIDILNPIVQSIGVNIILSTESLGQSKISPDGNKYAVARHDNTRVEKYDFDRTNANLSNLITIPTGTSEPFGVEFSPNNEVLYISTNTFLETSNGVYQYNLLAGNEAAIINSKTTLATLSLAFALQLGLDDKIYIAKFSDTHLDVINNPDVLGVGANYVVGQQLLAGRKSLISLPQFVRPVTP